MPPLSLHTFRRRLLALGFGLAALALAAAGMVRWFLASDGRTAWDKAALERAVRLETDNAAYRHRLGQWEESSLAEGSLERAITRYRQSVERNPYESEYWLDLANSLELTGERPEAEVAVSRALQVDSHTGRTLWRAGNFWLRANQPARAFPYFRQALAADPGLSWPVIQTCHRVLGDPDLLLREVLPPQTPFRLDYLKFLLRERETAAAARVWDSLVALREPFDLTTAFAYFDFLVSAPDVPQAEKVWAELQSLKMVPAASPAGGELLYNADLRMPVLNGGFDWRAVPYPHVSFALGPGRQGPEPPAVVISFSGEENLYFRHFFQFVPVTPNTRYRLQAWASTEDINTESGPRLEVVDVTEPQTPPQRSATVVGTTAWQPLTVEFVTGPRTRLVRVGLVRLPSNRLEGRIGGTVRVAEFSLRPVAGPS